MEVVVISDNKNHSKELETILIKHFLAPCTVTNSYLDKGEKPCVDQLILIDCAMHTHASATQLLSRLHRHGLHPRLALLNIRENSKLESLVEWPHVKGVFYKGCQRREYIDGLEALLAHKLWFSNHLMERLIEANRRPPIIRDKNQCLSQRELQVLSKLTQSESNSKIASSLNISEHTIKSHIYNIFRKIGVSNRMQACDWAKENLDGGRPR